MGAPHPSIIGDSLDAGTRRSLIAEANDGIMMAAGVIEGFAGAGASGATVVVAAVSALLAGGIVLAGARFAEEAAERDTLQALPLLRTLVWTLTVAVAAMTVTTLVGRSLDL